jgi:hypothetical protein
VVLVTSSTQMPHQNLKIRKLPLFKLFFPVFNNSRFAPYLTCTWPENSWLESLQANQPSHLHSFFSRPVLFAGCNSIQSMTTFPTFPFPYS